MGKPLCPKCGKPYLSVQVSKNPARMNSRAQEWYKHDDNNWCTQPVVRERTN